MNIFDSHQNKLVDFKINQDVKIYVCGVTPYDSAHLGHIFTFMFYDLMTRWLQFKGHKVKVVRNITDVDEPIYLRATELGMPYRKLAQEQTVLFKKTMEDMNFLRPYAEPLASQYIDQMADAVSKIIAKGYGYLVNKDVYFNTSKVDGFAKYFNLPNNVLVKLFKLRGGDPDRENKFNKLDFLLWKNIDNPRDPARWQTVLGWGRPGWHIECSVMSYQLLGSTFDLHGGGSDLIFPHHESEIAQSIVLNHTVPARYWVYVAPLLLYGEKMSKSLGNLVFGHDLIQKYHPSIIKLALMNYHYQVGGEWIKEYLDESKELYQGLRILLINKNISSDHLGSLKKAIYKAFNNNIDTPEMIYCLKLFLNNSQKIKVKNPKAQKELLELLNLLGIYV